jgi:hypothetical protein
LELEQVEKVELQEELHQQRERTKKLSKSVEPVTLKLSSLNFTLFILAQMRAANS